jgi:hypothetical protein
MQKDKIELLKDPRVRDEIARYKRIESETAGYEISDEVATQEWLSLYAHHWQKVFQFRSGIVSKPIEKRKENNEQRVFLEYFENVFV